MPTFVLLTRMSETAASAPRRLEELEKEMMRHIREECPTVEWINNLAVLGPYDYLDIFEAPDVETAAKVAAMVRTYGHAHTEVWGAVEWERYKELVRHLPDHELITSAVGA
jgi:uncharacterized protein with GYD domain